MTTTTASSLKYRLIQTVRTDIRVGHNNKAVPTFDPVRHLWLGSDLTDTNLLRLVGIHPLGATTFANTTTTTVLETKNHLGTWVSVDNAQELLDAAKVTLDEEVDDDPVFGYEDEVDEDSYLDGEDLEEFRHGQKLGMYI